MVSTQVYDTFFAKMFYRNRLSLFNCKHDTLDDILKLEYLMRTDYKINKIATINSLYEGIMWM